jgi:hypothetical protein
MLPVPKGRRSRALLLVAGLGALAAACVVETYPAPPKALLRDRLRAAASAASPSASSTPPVASTPGPSPEPPRDVPPNPQPDAPPPPASALACQVDADCVATLPNGCCHDGRNIPLNRNAVDAYRATFRCPTDRPRCPMHLVLDRRVAVCEPTTHACTLIDRPEAATP